MRIEEIKISDIVIPEERARATFTDEQHQELKASIEKNGFTVPILVRKRKDGKYELIDGEHRIQIVKELGWEKIPAVISEVDDARATLLNVLANTARGTQNPMDVAEALKRAHDAGISDEELAAAMGHTKSWVRLYLTLTELPDVYKEALRNGDLKVGHIKEAMRLNDPVEIDAALQSVLHHGWNVNVLRYYVDRRIEELRKAQEAGDREFLDTPPTPEYAKELVAYGDCMVCKRKVNRNDLSMPTVCTDCRTLLEYIVEQLGNPREAMQTIYNALNLYFDVTRRQKETQVQQQQKQQQEVQLVTAANPGAQNPQKEEPEFSKEELKFIKLLKLAKQEGII